MSEPIKYLLIFLCVCVLCMLSTYLICIYLPKSVQYTLSSGITTTIKLSTDSVRHRKCYKQFHKDLIKIKLISAVLSHQKTAFIEN